MACGELETVWVTWREWCWKGWGYAKIPWRCTKGEFLPRYRFDFAWIKPHLALFATDYEGCCGRTLYKWRVGCRLYVFCVGNGPMTWNVTLYFKDKPKVSGECVADPYVARATAEQAAGPAVTFAGPTAAIPRRQDLSEEEQEVKTGPR